MGKKRTDIGPELSAKVLFEADRICCVCRVPGKAVQIHHLDDNPSNHSENNLAVLCLECHRNTQIKGGFDRKLDAEQIVLYKQDWIAIIKQRRAIRPVENAPKTNNKFKMTYATSIAEIYKENKQYELLV